MKSQICVPLPTDVFLELVEFLREEKDIRDPVEVVSDAIRYFLDNASWKQDDLLVRSASLGFQWKSVFLPDGTQIRTSYKGSYFYATVEGDRVMHDGTATTPAAFANKIAGTSRNAWRNLWIKRPEDKEWTLADDLRPETKVRGDAALAEFVGTPKPKS